MHGTESFKALPRMDPSLSRLAFRIRAIRNMSMFSGSNKKGYHDGGASPPSIQVHLENSGYFFAVTLFQKPPKFHFMFHVLFRLILQTNGFHRLVHGAVVVRNGIEDGNYE